MGWTHLRSQITAQEKCNVDLIASNASLRKSNEKLASQLEELRTRNEELSSNNTSLVVENARILGKLDEVKEELEGEKASSVSLKSELESITGEAQAITVNAVLSVRAELMAEFKRAEHSSWDPDEEIRTWEKRKALIAGGEVSEDEEVEDELALVAGSLRPVEMGVDPEQSEPDVGAKEIVSEPVEEAASAENIAGD